MTELELLKKNIVNKIKSHTYQDPERYNEGFRDGLYESLRLIDKIEAIKTEIHYGDANDEVTV